MYPRPKMAREGRVNPKGISYLYLCDTEKTAMLECRPENGSDMTVQNLNYQRICESLIFHKQIKEYQTK
jgi:RES domain-containing protein